MYRADHRFDDRQRRTDASEGRSACDLPAMRCPAFDWRRSNALRRTTPVQTGKYRCIVVTDDAITVLESSKWSGGARPQEVVGRMPRHTRLGPVSGRWAEVDLLGERHWVHRRFHDQIEAADREAGFQATSPRTE